MSEVGSEEIVLGPGFLGCFKDASLGPVRVVLVASSPRTSSPLRLSVRHSPPLRLPTDHAHKPCTLSLTKSYCHSGSAPRT